MFGIVTLHIINKDTLVYAYRTLFLYIQKQIEMSVFSSKIKRLHFSA